MNLFTINWLKFIHISARNYRKPDVDAIVNIINPFFIAFFIELINVVLLCRKGYDIQSEFCLSGCFLYKYATERKYILIK